MHPQQQGQGSRHRRRRRIAHRQRAAVLRAVKRDIVNRNACIALSIVLRITLGHEHHRGHRGPADGGTDERAAYGANSNLHSALLGIGRYDGNIPAAGHKRQGEQCNKERMSSHGILKFIKSKYQVLSIQ